MSGALVLRLSHKLFHLIFTVADGVDIIIFIFSMRELGTKEVSNFTQASIITGRN